MIIESESNVTPKSITEFTGTSSLPRKGILVSGNLASICHEPKTMSFVLLGLISSWLEQHHSAM